MKSRLKLAGIIAAAVLAAGILGILAATFSFGRGDRICRGVTISGIGVGGLTRGQAGKAVQNWARSRLNRGVVLTALDLRWTSTSAALGARVEWRRAVDEAFAVGREGNIIGRAICVLSSARRGQEIEARVLVNHAKARRVLARIAKAADRPHRDARIHLVKNHLEVEQDACGVKVDLEAAVKMLSRALNGESAVVALPVILDKPDITTAEASRINTLLGGFTTTFNPGNRGRTRNLKLAAGCIDGSILKSGQRFSLNASVGPRVAERGYMTAQIFVRGRLEEGVGGGVCQVSSTLYNTVLLAGLKVIERHPHSRTVPYVTAGRDATVAYPARDFKFENSYGSPVCIIARVKGARLTIDIYGAAEDRKKIEVYTARTGAVAPGQETVVDRSLKPGEKKVVDKGSRGVSVTVYRRVSDGNGSVTTEVVSRDRYGAQKSVIAVGPSAAEPAPTRATDGVSTDALVLPD